MENASLTAKDLARKIGLSAAAANERVRRLKKLGIIKKISAIISAEFMDMNLAAFIYVAISGQDFISNFLKQITEYKFILECHHVTGEYDYMLKVRCKNTKQLEEIITNFLKGKCGVNKTFTQIILSSHKDQALITD